MSKETYLSPLQQAEKEIPKAWYENMLLLYGTGIGAFFLIQGLRLSVVGLPIAHVVSAGLYGISTIVDDRSTVGTLKANDRAKEVGIKSQYKETNPVFWGVETAEQYKNRKVIRTGWHLLQTALVATSPEVGIFSGTRLLAAANNRRKELRLTRATEIATGKQ